MSQAVDDCADLHTRAWQQLAVDEGRAAVPHWALRRAEGMKNEQARFSLSPFVFPLSPFESMAIAGFHLLSVVAALFFNSRLGALACRRHEE